MISQERFNENDSLSYLLQYQDHSILMFSSNTWNVSFRCKVPNSTSKQNNLKIRCHANIRCKFDKYNHACHASTQTGHCGCRRLCQTVTKIIDELVTATLSQNELGWGWSPTNKNLCKLIGNTGCWHQAGFLAVIVRSFRIIKQWGQARKLCQSCFKGNRLLLSLPDC